MHFLQEKFKVWISFYIDVDSYVVPHLKLDRREELLSWVGAESFDSC